MTPKQFFHNIKDRLEALEENGNGCNNNGGNGGAERPKGVIKPPPREIVLQYCIEHPQFTAEDIAKHFRERMALKYYHAERFKKEFADGDKWHISHWEELAESKMNGHDRHWREQERARRRKVGTLTKLVINDKDKTFEAEYDKECSEEEDGTTERLTTEQFHKILGEANNNIE